MAVRCRVTLPQRRRVSAVRVLLVGWKRHSHPGQIRTCGPQSLHRRDPTAGSRSLSHDSVTYMLDELILRSPRHAAPASNTAVLRTDDPRATT